MSPLSNLWRPNHGGSTVRIPAEDLQLRVQVSRESEVTAAPSVETRTSNTLTVPPSPSHHSPRQLHDDALGEFFGGRSQRTRTQRRAPPPPAYSPDWDGEKLPGYTSSPNFEVETVARHLFKYGFFFPLFWAVGVYFLFSPMRVTADWQSDKTEEEKAQLLSEMREAEVKWARRCLWALLSFVVCLAILVIAVVASRRR